MDTPKVYTAIAAITAELAKTGIGKDGRNSQQGYNFRGIDQVYGALAPLLSTHKLCVIPRMLERETVERTTQKGGALFYTTVKAAFDFVSAEDGSKHEATTFGEAMDSGDKSTNKAMSAAYKYAAFMTFCIPVEGESPDADQETHEVAGRGTTTKAPAKAAQKPAGAPAPVVTHRSPDTPPDTVTSWTTKLIARMEGIKTEEAMKEIGENPNIAANRKKLTDAWPKMGILIADAERAMFERVGKHMTDQNWVDNEIPGGRAAA